MIILTCCDISLYCYPQCKPYNVSDKALIIGDAAHAMVPFFAQGMNSVSTFFVVLHHRNTRRVDGGGFPYEKVVNTRSVPSFLAPFCSFAAFVSALELFKLPSYAG